MSTSGAGVETSEVPRVPSEWIAALVILVVAAAIRVILGGAAITSLALAGLLPLVLIYCMMGAIRRLSSERLASMRTRGRRQASLLVVGVALLPLPLLLFTGASEISEVTMDRGLGMGLGGYFIALLELGQLYVLLSGKSPSRQAGGTGFSS